MPAFHNWQQQAFSLGGEEAESGACVGFVCQGMVEQNGVRRLHAGMGKETADKGKRQFAELVCGELSLVVRNGASDGGFIHCGC